MENVFKKIIIKAIKESVIINSVICDIVVTVQISAQSLKKKKKIIGFWVILKSGDTYWRTTVEDIQCIMPYTGQLLLCDFTLL